MTAIRSAELQDVTNEQYPTFTFPTAEIGDRVIIIVFGGNQVTGLGWTTWTHHDKRTGQEAQGGVWSRIITEDDGGLADFTMDGSDPIRAAVIVIEGSAPLTLLEVGRDGAVGTTFPAYSEPISGAAVAGSTAFYFTGSRNSTDVPTCSNGTEVELYSGTHTAGLWREDFTSAGTISASLGIPIRSGHYRAAILLGPNYVQAEHLPFGVSGKTDIGPRTNEDTESFGGIARARDDIAVAVWQASDSGADVNGVVPTPPVGLWCRAMRWTSGGPVLGDLTGIDSVPQVAVSDLFSGREGEVWYAGIEYWSTGASVCGVITADENLTCTLTSHNSIGTWGSTGKDMIAAAWPAKNLILVVKNYGVPPTWAPAVLILANVRTGAVIATRDLPYYVEEMSFHVDGGKVIIWSEIADNPPYGIVREWGIWTMDITATSISTPVEIYRTSGGGGLRLMQATATPSGWAALMMPQSNLRDVAYLEVSLDGVVSLNPVLEIGTGVLTHWDEHMGEMMSMIYDEDADCVISFHGNGNDSGLTPVRWKSAGEHEAGPILPGTEKASYPGGGGQWFANNADLCKVGVDRYFFMVIGSYGSTITGDNYGNYSQVVWLGGAEVPLITTGTELPPDLSRQAFRRNR